MQRNFKDLALLIYGNVSFDPIGKPRKKIVGLPCKASWTYGCVHMARCSSPLCHARNVHGTRFWCAQCARCAWAVKRNIYLNTMKLGTRNMADTEIPLPLLASSSMLVGRTQDWVRVICYRLWPSRVISEGSWGTNLYFLITYLRVCVCSRFLWTVVFCR